MDNHSKLSEYAFDAQLFWFRGVNLKIIVRFFFKYGHSGDKQKLWHKKVQEKTPEKKTQPKYYYCKNQNKKLS